MEVSLPQIGEITVSGAQLANEPYQYKYPRENDSKKEFGNSLEEANQEFEECGHRTEDPIVKILALTRFLFAGAGHTK